jgi:hypothetical protein
LRLLCRLTSFRRITGDNDRTTIIHPKDQKALNPNLKKRLLYLFVWRRFSVSTQHWMRKNRHSVRSGMAFTPKSRPGVVKSFITRNAQPATLPKGSAVKQQPRLPGRPFSQIGMV